ncbi:MAG: PepSY-like domain-containing protein [Muribaculaceae bacterium]|nr:PepSY-like domain-containing protein [Muribaculaceae bacterium]
MPAAIASYVRANLQNLPITKIENHPYGYEIELSNGVEAKFNPNGHFVGYDD